MGIGYNVTAQPPSIGCDVPKTDTKITAPTSNEAPAVIVVNNYGYDEPIFICIGDAEYQCIQFAPPLLLVNKLYEKSEKATKGFAYQKPFRRARSSL